MYLYLVVEQAIVLPSYVYPGFSLVHNYYDCFSIEYLGDTGLELISTPVSQVWHL